MAEVAERVAKLEERLDSLTTGLAEVKAAVRDEAATLRAEVRADMAGLRAEMRAGEAGLRAEMQREFADLRTEMNTQFRWLMAGIGSTTLAVLVALFTR